MRGKEPRQQAGQPAGASAQAGFSLPEIMVVLAIILLLAVLAVPNYQPALEHAEEAAAQANLDRIHTAQEAHRITHGEYAPTFQLLQSHKGGGGPGEPEPLPDEADTGEGAGGESVMVHRGYIYRLNRTAPDRYTVSAEPIRKRDTRPHYQMDFLGNTSIYVGGEKQEAAGGAGVAPPGGEENPPNQ